MNRRFRAILAVVTPILLLLVVAAWGAGAGAAQRSTAVEFAVTGAELKGTTTIASLAPPSDDPATLSDGYRYKGPGDADPADPTKWEVSSYVWVPSAMTVFQGDTVSLRIFSVNGDKHEVWVQAPDGSEVIREQELNRGRDYTLTFAASQRGYYTLVCTTHDPTMTAVITAL
ncbi:MAG: hypothetical protein HY534_04550 [Chloroflexi bacterium]|nr:hypothetical protein [Chloroflexota bacterium]